jgi:hypothetical protein
MRGSRAHLRGSIHPSLIVFGAIVVLLLGSVPVSAAAPGTKTSQDPMLTPVGAGITAEAIITVGETAGDDGYIFEAIPDGISIRNRGKDTVEAFVNHETSRVPFPYPLPPGTPTAANAQNDFDNAQLSRLILNKQTAGVQTGKLVITSNENYQRFCSNYLATAAEGFDRDLLFTNEETPDWINRSGNAWPTTVGAATAREAGVVVAFDPKTNKNRPIWGMGRHNHENSVAIPGFDELVLLSGDDTFTTTPSQSQLYSYSAPNAEAIWNDEGTLRAFVSDGAKKKYDDFTLNDSSSVSGHFEDVPPLIASGRNPDGTDLMSDDVPVDLDPGDPGAYVLPPNDGTWQRDPVTGNPVDGPQWVLEQWSRRHEVFAFVRVEDIAYDKRPGMSNVAYIVDSGRGSTGAVANGKSTNGRIWKMVFDPDDATKVTSLSILIEGDDNEVKTLTEMHQPDNIESTANALYFTEDPGSSQQFPAGSTEANATTARVWQYRFDTGVNTVALKVDQSADEGPTDNDLATTRGNWGAWESTGIVDASAAFGPGAFLINVQAHTLWVEKADGDDNFAPVGPDFTNKREGGQLLLVRIPNG